MRATKPKQTVMEVSSASASPRRVKISLSQALVYLIPAICLAPSLVWVLSDKSVWPWDQSWYGEVSIELFYTLTHAPSNWIPALVSAFGAKAPGIAWLGQFYVPLGVIFGSIDTGLLLSVLTMQFATLILTIRYLSELTGGQTLISATGGLITASAPLFVAMSHQYFVEAMQLLGVSWFILIATRSPKWNPWIILGHLMTAGSFALLAKVSSPLYCVCPLVIASGYLLKPFDGNSGLESNWRQKKHLITFAMGALLLTGTVAWYARNLNEVLRHVRLSATGSSAELYGVSESFLHQSVYWGSALQQSVAFPAICALFVVLVSAGLLRLLFRRSSLSKRFAVFAAVSAVQLVLVLAAFSVSSNRENRYLLPLMPYITILVCWALAELGKNLLTGSLILTLTVQMLLVHSQALGDRTPSRTISYWLRTANSDRHNANTLYAIVDSTCSSDKARTYNIIGVEFSWLNANSASYYIAKRLLKTGYRCYYTSLGYAETDVEKAWKRILDLKARYFVSIESSILSSQPDAFNIVSKPILQRVKSSDHFVPKPFASDPDILIFQSLTTN